MKNKPCLLPVSLIIIELIVFLTIILTHTFFPSFVIPKASIPNLTLISVLSLLLDYFLKGYAKRSYPLLAVFSLLSFFLLPLASGYAPLNEAIKLAVAGAVTFLVTTFLFTSAITRLKTGPKAPFAPILTALTLFMASQCFQGMIF